MARQTVVLVVEDEAIIRMGAVQLLEEAGFAVVEASNAHDAVNILEDRNDICAIFTDINMPGTMDGLRLARIVRGRWPPIHLIVTSGLISPNDDDLPPGGRFTLEVRSDDGVTTADISVSLGLIVTELVINALKHAFPYDRKGKILVDYETHTANWTLSVADDGVGMPTLPNSAKAGLGTSIVQSLAKQLGATINVAEENPGTKVSIVHAHVPVLVSQSMASNAAV